MSRKFLHYYEAAYLVYKLLLKLLRVRLSRFGELCPIVAGRLCPQYLEYASNPEV